MPVEDQPKFRAWTHLFLNPAAGGGMAKLREALQNFQEYLQQFITQRRAERRDDLVSELLNTQEASDTLTHDEMMAIVYLILVAGHETTTQLLATGTLELLRHPDELHRLCSDRSLVPSAVEELLRYCGPAELSFARFALHDAELYGQPISTWDVVRLNYLSANRDPEQFPDPDRLDLGRSPNKHVGFGYGIHFCLGAPLARLEASIALEQLSELLPRLQLAVPADQLVWRPTAQIRGLMALPLRV